MYITAQGSRLRNDLYCVKWDVKLYYTIPYHTMPSPQFLTVGAQGAQENLWGTFKKEKD